MTRLVRAPGSRSHGVRRCNISILSASTLEREALAPPRIELKGWAIAQDDDLFIMVSLEDTCDKDAAGVAGVLGATSAARGLDRKDPEHPVYDGFVIGCRLNRCVVCSRLHGHVLERDNSRIPVLCKCERTSKDVTSM